MLDPFAGRASSIYAACAMGRTGYGVEIHPVGWLYGKVKLAPAAKNWVLNRVDQIGELARRVTKRKLDRMPEFYHVCYCEDVLRYLIAARENLDYENSRVDATLMAIILVNLHGKRVQCLSNQMRQGKAMDPNYSIRWWKARRMNPPERDPVAFLRSRVEWRYKKGVPELAYGHVELGDSTATLKRMIAQRRARGAKRFDLVFTSPPYYGVTNYFYDQWLRLWMLGGPELPTATGEQWGRKFESKVDYKHLLESVFKACAEGVSRNAIIYVRTDARNFTFETTRDVLLEAFPDKTMYIMGRPYNKATQTALYGDKTKKPGEVDITLY
ncbi:MAG TPA: hypothetical protein VLJ61_09580 [Pyrinomonadaceae bacterium]|nr:hypothetical protein [Pyrinomonadaceae bacterium]